MEKCCYKCNSIKGIENFHKDRTRKDGLSSLCKECAYIKTRKYFDTEKGKMVRRKSERRSERIKAKKLYSKTKERRDYQREYNKRNAQSIKTIARWKVRNAINGGKLVRPLQCTFCNKKCKPNAHHIDYTKPLDILWLCVKCHKKIHFNY